LVGLLIGDRDFLPNFFSAEYLGIFVATRIWCFGESRGLKEEEEDDDEGPYFGFGVEAVGAEGVVLSTRESTEVSASAGLLFFDGVRVVFTKIILLRRFLRDKSIATGWSIVLPSSDTLFMIEGMLLLESNGKKNQKMKKIQKIKNPKTVN